MTNTLNSWNSNSNAKVTVINSYSNSNSKLQRTVRSQVKRKMSEEEQWLSKDQTMNEKLKLQKSKKKQKIKNQVSTNIGGAQMS